LYGSSSLAGGHTQTYSARTASTHIDNDADRYPHTSIPTKVTLSTQVIVTDEGHRYRRKSSLSTKVIVIDASHRYRRKSSIPTAGGVESDAKLAELRYLGGLARWFPRALVCGRGIRNSGKLPPTVRATNWKILWAFPSWKIPFGQSYLRGIPLPNRAHSRSCKNPAPSRAPAETRRTHGGQAYH